MTFDDGPGTVTPAILDVLAHHGARATFDLLGPRVAAEPGATRRIARERHEIGVHGWDHRDLAGAPARALSGVARARAVIRAVTGIRPRVFRPPYGSTCRRLVLGARALGLVTVTWDVDPRDYEEPGAGAIRDRVGAAVRPGSVILLHDDRPGLAPTAEALDGILDDLAARGLAAVTVSELLAGAPGPRRAYPSARP